MGGPSARHHHPRSHGFRAERSAGLTTIWDWVRASMGVAPPIHRPFRESSPALRSHQQGVAKKEKERVLYCIYSKILDTVLYCIVLY